MKSFFFFFELLCFRLKNPSRPFNPFLSFYSLLAFFFPPTMRDSPLYIYFFSIFLYNKVVLPYKSLIYFVFFFVFLSPSYYCVLFYVGFRRLDITGTNVLGDSNGQVYLMRHRH